MTNDIRKEMDKKEINHVHESLREKIAKIGDIPDGDITIAKEIPYRFWKIEFQHKITTPFADMWQTPYGVEITIDLPRVDTIEIQWRIMDSENYQLRVLGREHDYFNNIFVLTKYVPPFKSYIIIKNGKTWVIKIIDKELQEKFEHQTEKNAIWGQKMTKSFLKWLNENT